jgi:hypothetical protein
MLKCCRVSTCYAVVPIGFKTGFHMKQCLCAYIFSHNHISEKIVPFVLYNFYVYFFHNQMYRRRWIICEFLLTYLKHACLSYAVNFPYPGGAESQPVQATVIIHIFILAIHLYLHQLSHLTLMTHLPYNSSSKTLSKEI